MKLSDLRQIMRNSPDDNLKAPLIDIAYDYPSYYDELGWNENGGKRALELSVSFPPKPCPPLARAPRPSHTLSGLFAMLDGRRQLDTISATTMPAFREAYDRCAMLDSVGGEQHWRNMRHVIREVI